MLGSLWYGETLQGASALRICAYMSAGIRRYFGRTAPRSNTTKATKISAPFHPPTKSQLLSSILLTIHRHHLSSNPLYPQTSSPSQQHWVWECRDSNGEVVEWTGDINILVTLGGNAVTNYTFRPRPGNIISQYHCLSLLTNIQTPLMRLVHGSAISTLPPSTPTCGFITPPATLGDLPPQTVVTSGQVKTTIRSTKWRIYVPCTPK